MVSKNLKIDIQNDNSIYSDIVELKKLLQYIEDKIIFLETEIKNLSTKNHSEFKILNLSLKAEITSKRVTVERIQELNNILNNSN